MNVLISECLRFNFVSNDRERRKWAILTRNYGSSSRQIYFKNTREERKLLIHLIKVIYLKIHGKLSNILMFIQTIHCAVILSARSRLLTAIDVTGK